MKHHHATTNVEGEQATATHTDPVCGMVVDPASAAGTHEYKGKTYYFCSAGCVSKFKADPNRYAPTETSHKDPVCGMDVSPETAAAVVEHDGRMYYFCSKSCEQKFKEDPAAYTGRRSLAQPSRMPAGSVEHTCPMHPEVRQLGPGSCPKCGMALEPVAPVSAARKVEYTCPMHPEIIRAEPGSCPICGMALEPREVTGEEVNPELVDMSRRFRASAALTLPILAFMVSEMIPSHPLKEWLGSDALLWLQFALASPVVLWGAGRSFTAAGSR